MRLNHILLQPLLVLLQDISRKDMRLIGQKVCVKTLITLDIY